MTILNTGSQNGSPIPLVARCVTSFMNAFLHGVSFLLGFNDAIYDLYFLLLGKNINISVYSGIMAIAIMAFDII